MKALKMTLGVILVFFLVSSVAAAGDFDWIRDFNIQAAADVLRPAYDASRGGDGFVSLEVSPKLAHDTAGTIAEAERLWRRVARPNVMIKIPGTVEGLPAITHCLADGVNANLVSVNPPELPVSPGNNIATRFPFLPTAIPGRLP